MGKKLTNCIAIAGLLLIVISFYFLYSLEFSYGASQIGEEDNTTLAAGYEKKSASDNAAALASLEVQPSAADAHIRDGESSSNNFGDKTSIWLKKAIVGFQRRGILSFDFSALDDSAVIESAYLDLYYFNNSIGNDPASETVEVNRLTQTGWVEDEATWNGYKNVTPWTTAGGDYTATDQAAALMPGAFGWVRWTVTEQIRNAQRNTSEIANMLVKFSSSAAPNAAARFLSKESADPSRHPRLIINYTMNGVVERPAPAPVAITGQTSCFDADGNKIDCANTGQDGELQEGVPWPIPRFTDNEDGTITDNMTHLIWDKHAQRWPLLSWMEALERCNQLAAAAPPADGWKDVELTDGSVAGDWHLPNKNQLLSLLSHGTPGGGSPGYNIDVFEQIEDFDHEEGASYWSSTTAFENPVQLPERAYGVSFINGQANDPDKAFGLNVWCVRKTR